ncbi:hypothetical protein AQUCO_00400370v1 [Aquilegia coerulea]|uniref:Uncharacterized protein n=1 Tax=Aquilegia coerulea TaxID=218851 RepID=A0A2G5EUV1_AQUCA|nr:hypothetical protein AQUCO_00400370v1 [Aquilegia coerulea]
MSDLSKLTVNEKSSSSSSSEYFDQGKKKAIPWSEEEHKLFLLGLKKYGKGDWRNISRNFVITRTPTQVASHAQKYDTRQQRLETRSNDNTSNTTTAANMENGDHSNNIRLFPGYN